MMLTVSSIWLRPPPVLHGLGNDLRLAMWWYPTTGARAVRRHLCAPPRKGELNRISVERARERRLNIEGRNVNADLDAAAPKPLGNARI